MSESDQVVFTMKVDVDTASLDTKLRTAESSLDNIWGSLRQINAGFSDMPNSVGVMTDSLTKADGVIKSASDHLQTLKDNKVSSQDAQRFHDSITASIGEVGAMSRILGSGGDFSIQIAKNMLGSLPSAIRQELDAVLPSISNIVRSRMSTMSKNGYGINNSTATVARSLVNDKEVAKLFSQMPTLSKQANGGQVFEQYLQTMLPHIAPMGHFNEYRVQRFGTPNPAKYQALKDPSQVLPQSFRSAYAQKGYTREVFDDAVGSTVLTAAYRQQLGQLMSNNPIAVRAALSSGIANRNDSGVLQMRQEITRNQFEGFREHLYNELINRAQGRAQDEIPNSHRMRSRIQDPYSTNPNTQETLARRMMTSSAGQALMAMQTIEGFEKSDNWTESKGSNAYLALPKEARRSLEQYAVRQYTPWDTEGRLNGRRVSITESQGTRMLGMTGKHNQDVDDIILVSSRGYDKNNAEHRKLAMQYFSDEGVDINGERYIAQGSHGTGEDTAIRMIKKSTMDRVIAENEEWAKANGFVGSDVFKNFVPSEYITSHKLFGKQDDAVNKMFTPGAESGVNFQGKKIGIVDWGDYGDGIGWLSADMLPNSAQVRVGTGGKGTLRTVKDLREFATHAGLLDDEGRWMVRGVGGEMFNALDVDGLMDISMIKNKGAFGSATGSRFNDMATAMMQRFGMSYVTDFSTEDAASDKMGSQMSEFMKYSPYLQRQQTDALQERLKALDTETGIRRYVLTNPNDPLTAAVEKDPELIYSDQVRHRTELYKQSLLARANAGEWIDFGNNELRNERLTTTPIEAYLRSQGGITKSVLNQARQYIKKDDGSNYSDDELIDMITLRNGGVISFDSKDSEYLGVGRSPTGFGQMIYGKNYAKQLEAYYDALGLDKSGIQVSREDRDKLATADLDGDTVKVIRGRLLEAVQETIKSVPDIDKRLTGVETRATTPDYEPGDNAQNKVGAFERKIDATRGMGFGSSIGQSAVQLDLSDPKNNKFAIAALKGNTIYGNATDNVKHLTESDLSGENAVWDSWKLGKEYQKLAAHTDRLFNVQEFEAEREQAKAEGRPFTNPNFFMPSNADMPINLNALRQMDISHINLPSMYEDSMLAAVMQTTAARRTGRAETLSMQAAAIQEALNLDEFANPAGAGDNTKALMQNMNATRLQFMTGERGMITKAEYEDLQKMRADALTEITAEADTHLIEGTGKVMVDGKEMSRNRYIEQQATKFGLNVVDNIGTFGFYEPALRALVGEGLIGNFQNAATAVLPNKASTTKVDEAVQVEQEQEQAPTKPKKFSAKRVKRDAAAIQDMEYDPTKTLEEQYGKLFAGFADQAASQNLLSNLTNGFHEVNNRFMGTINGNITQTAAEKFFGISNSQLYNARRDYKDAIDNGNKDVFAPNSAARQKLDKEFYNIEENYMAATRSFAESNGTKALEDLRKAVTGVGDEFDKQLQSLENFDKKVEEIASTYQQFKKARTENADNSDEGKQKDATVMDNLEKQMAEAAALRDQGKINIQNQNATNFAERYDALNYKMTGKLMTPEQKIERQVAGYQKDIDAELEKLERAREKNLIKEEDYNANKKRYDDLREYAYGGLTDDLLARERVKDDKNFNNLISQGDKLGRRQMNNQTLIGRNLMYNQQELEQRRQYGDRLNDQLKEKQNLLQDYKDKGMGPGNAQYDKVAGQVNTLTDAINKNQAAMSGLTGVAGGMNAVLSAVGTTVGRLGMQFGRRLFTQAIQETKKFVKEFDASMNEIQMITMKSDSQMQPIRSQTLSKAIGLRTSVSNVATTEAALYRQGLSDQEVSTRTDKIIQFATVTGVKVNDAMKGITTAMQSGLVATIDEAMDALVALGDSAATTAAEIEKGMQRSAAAAKVAGVSYAELTTLLTIGTSKTQLGGSQIGRSLSTIFSRMRKVTQDGYVSDVNGKTTSLNDVESALSLAGINLRTDDKQSFRDPFEILRDLSKVWQQLGDIQKSVITNALSTTQQSNVFQTLMEGMSEDDGAELDRLLGLAENSQGITETKYEIAAKRITSSLETLKSSFDAFVESFTVDLPIPDFFNGIADFFTMLSNVTSKSSGIVTGVAAITGVIAGLIATCAMAATPLAPVAGLLGLAVGAAAFAGVTTDYNNFIGPDEKTIEQRRTEAFSSIDKMDQSRNNRYEKITSVIGEVESLGKTFDETGGGANELYAALQKLSIAFPSINLGAQSSEEAVENWKSMVDEATKSADALYLANNRMRDSEVLNWINNYGQGVYEKELYGDGVIRSNFEYQQFVNDPTGLGYGKYSLMSTDAAHNVKTLNPLMHLYSSNSEALDYKRNYMHALTSDGGRWNNGNGIVFNVPTILSDILRDYGDFALTWSDYGYTGYNDLMENVDNGDYAGLFDFMFKELFNPDSGIYKSIFGTSLSEISANSIPTLKNYVSEWFPRIGTISDYGFTGDAVLSGLLDNLDYDNYRTETGDIDVSKVVSNVVMPWLAKYDNKETRREAFDQIAPDVGSEYIPYSIRDEDGNILGRYYTEEEAISAGGTAQTIYHGDRLAYQSVRDVIAGANQAYQSEHPTYAPNSLQYYNEYAGVYDSFNDFIGGMDEAFISNKLNPILANNDELRRAFELARTYDVGTGYGLSMSEFEDIWAQSITGNKTSSYLAPTRRLFNESPDEINMETVQSWLTGEEYSDQRTQTAKYYGQDVYDAIADYAVRPAEDKLYRIQDLMRIADTNAYLTEHYADNPLLGTAQSYMKTITTGTAQERDDLLSTLSNASMEADAANEAYRRIIGASSEAIRPEDYETVSRYTGFTLEQLQNSSWLENHGREINGRIASKKFGTLDAVQMVLDAITGGDASTLFKADGSLNLSGISDPGVQKFITALYNGDNGYTLLNDGTITMSSEYSKQKELSVSDYIAHQRDQMNYNNQANAYSLLSDALARGGIETLSGTDAEKVKSLFESDNMLLALNELGNPMVLNEYIGRKAKGQQGTFYDNYGWMMDTMFGDAWVNGNFDWDNATKTYAENSGNTFWMMWFDAMISTMPNGAEIKELLANGNVKDFDTDVLLNYAQNATQTNYESNLKSKGIEHAGEIASLVTTLQTGTSDKILETTSSYMQQLDQLQRAQYLFDRGTEMSSAESSELSSYLGIDQKNLERMMKTSTGRSLIEEAIAEKYSDIQQILATSVSEFIDVNAINLNGDVGQQIIDQLNNSAGRGLVAIVEKMGLAIDEASGQVVVTIPGDALNPSSKDAFNSAWTDYEAANRDHAIVTGMRNALTNYQNLLPYDEYVKTHPEVSEDEYYNLDSFIDANPNLKDDDLEKFYSNNPALMLMRKRWENGDATTAQFAEELNRMYYGGEKTDAYYNTEADMLGLDFSSTTGLVDSINSIMQSGDLTMIDALKEYAQYIPELTDAFSEMSESGTLVQETLDNITTAMGVKSLEAAVKHKKNGKEIVDIYKQLKAGGADATRAIGQVNTTLNGLNNKKWAIDQYASGDRSDKVVGILKQFGFEEAELKDASDEFAAMAVESMRTAFNEESGNFLNLIDTDFLNPINEMLAGNETIDWDVVINADGTVNTSALTAAIGAENANILAMLQSMQGLGLAVVSDEAGGYKIVANLGAGLGSSYRGGGGGGGGGGKSKADKLISEIKHQDAVQDHLIKMIQYQETRFKNDSQLGNYGKMLEEEIRLEEEFIPLLQKHIDEMKAQIAVTKIGSDDWYSLRDAIFKAEEEIENTTNAIKDNKRVLEENRQAILALKTDMQSTVLAEIQTREQEQRNMLSGRVNMEQTILDVIRKRYQDEWDLLKKDIEKKKQALQEELSLIDERLQKRKNAENEAQKYEELARLKQQLAQVSLDPTRTKDAIELRKKIADLEKEIAWDVADSEANAEKERLQEQIDAYDEYEVEYEEHLQNFLEDATNFADEVNKVLKMSHDDMIKWLEENDTSYAQSLEATQKQMKQSWEDTYKEMFGIVETYWGQIAGILSSKETFIQFMMNSSSFKNASAEQQEQYKYTWGKMYDDWFKAQDTSATYNHGESDESAGLIGDSLVGTTQTTSPTHWKVYWMDDQIGMCYTSESAARARIESYAEQKKQELINSGSTPAEAANRVSAWKNNAKTRVVSGTHANGYLTGGLVDYTGPAWVDGTPSKPEAFLSADDTALMRQMLDAAKTISIPSFLSNISSDSYSTSTSNIGDINITLYEAKFENDADYNEVARRIGEAFTKELTKQGLHTAAYTF